MNKRLSFAVSVLCTLSILCFSNPSAAISLSNKETCVSSAYSCASNGYSGTDPYGYYNFSSVDSSGRLHNCTSYAAYQLQWYTPYDSRYSGFGDASMWASRARNIGLTVGSVAHVGDVAQWNFGHVAFVEEVYYKSNGAVSYIVTTDDNYGRQVTTRKILYPGISGVIQYPDNFISFPSFGGGGTRPPVAAITPSTGY